MVIDDARSFKIPSDSYIGSYWVRICNICSVWTRRFRIFNTQFLIVKYSSNTHWKCSRFYHQLEFAFHSRFITLCVDNTTHRHHFAQFAHCCA